MPVKRIKRIKGKELRKRPSFRGSRVCMCIEQYGIVYRTVRDCVSNSTGFCTFLHIKILKFSHKSLQFMGLSVIYAVRYPPFFIKGG